MKEVFPNYAASSERRRRYINIGHNSAAVLAMAISLLLILNSDTPSAYHCFYTRCRIWVMDRQNSIEGIISSAPINGHKAANFGNHSLALVLAWRQSARRLNLDLQAGKPLRIACRSRVKDKADQSRILLLGRFSLAQTSLPSLIKK